jgi:hypothetical protein
MTGLGAAITGIRQCCCDARQGGILGPAASLVLVLRRRLVFPGFMMADRAPGGGAQETVMTRHVSGGTANHGALDASLCISRNYRRHNEQRQYQTA